MSEVNLAQYIEDEYLVVSQWVKSLKALHKLLGSHPMVHSSFNYLVERGELAFFKETRIKRSYLL